MHINVLDTEILKKAKERPQDYPNLQVRLCGWNVLFSTLSDKEKDEFIARSRYQALDMKDTMPWTETTLADVENAVKTLKSYNLNAFSGD